MEQKIIGRFHSKYLHDILNNNIDEYFTYQNTIHLNHNEYFCKKWEDIFPNVITKHEQVTEDIYVCKFVRKIEKDN
jgi:hypothetical protein